MERGLRNVGQTFVAANNALYNSSAFEEVATENAAFLQSLTSVVGGRSVTLANMYNIFDYMNVQSIHNATFLASVTSQTLEQVRSLANYHESQVFSSSNPGAIENSKFPLYILLKFGFSRFL